MIAAHMWQTFWRWQIDKTQEVMVGCWFFWGGGNSAFREQRSRLLSLELMPNGQLWNYEWMSLGLILWFSGDNHQSLPMETTYGCSHLFRSLELPGTVPIFLLSQQIGHQLPVGQRYFFLIANGSRETAEWNRIAEMEETNRSCSFPRLLSSYFHTSEETVICIGSFERGMREWSWGKQLQPARNAIFLMYFFTHSYPGGDPPWSSEFVRNK